MTHVLRCPPEEGARPYAVIYRTALRLVFASLARKR